MDAFMIFTFEHCLLSEMFLPGCIGAIYLRF